MHSLLLQACIEPVSHSIYSIVGNIIAPFFVQGMYKQTMKTFRVMILIDI